MTKFGFASSLLKLSSKNPLNGFLPDRWRYWQGPLKFGEIIGVLPQENVKGLGWKLPENTAEIWANPKLIRLWQRFLSDLHYQEIKIIGLDPGNSFYPPVTIRNQPSFPGISDGKALELLLFINRFRGILRNNDISPLKAKAMVIWEEGNLGITCARLIAREVRFLSLISPNERSLERAAELIYSETGVSAQIYLTPPTDLHGAKVVIKCGKLSKYQLIRNSKRIVWCELFQKCPSLPSLNMDLPIIVRGKFGEMPLYPALGEAILRSRFDLNYGFWYGSELPLERVIKLAICFRELGREIAV